MKKVGIISELNMSNVNYGNRLQAYALNYYINNNFNVEANSIIFSDSVKKKITNSFFVEYCKCFAKKIMTCFWYSNNQNSLFNNRLNECNRFTLDKIKIDFVKNYHVMQNRHYDYLFVGSDVVWAQFNHGVNRIKFLDFGKEKNNVRKISYAASFGINWIPNENKDYISKQLNSFYNISVREEETVKLLEDINVKNVNHVCDPTLLIDENQWSKLEKSVSGIGKKKYIFTYLLGKDEKHRKVIKEFAKDKGYLIVNIPHANMVYDKIDNDFADISVNDCSPEQWLWLIHNSSLVITDSFHGCVFSTIFKKNFIVLKRQYTTDINIRMKDYLFTIGQSDKFVTVNDFNNNIDNLSWDYDKINKRIRLFVEKSKDYINESINGNN